MRLLLLLLLVGVRGQLPVVPPHLPLFLPLPGHLAPVLYNSDDVAVDVGQLALGPDRRLDVLHHSDLK